MATHWLSIVGIGADGAHGLGPEARRRVAAAALVVGGARHLDEVSAVASPDADRMLWRRPIEATFPAILSRRPDPVVVLASGDPFAFGVGSMLAPLARPGEWDALPQVSAVSLACARLGWALQDVPVVSLCGRAVETLLPHLQPGGRVLVLSAGAETADAVIALLRARGGFRSTVAVLERLGAHDERIRTCRVRDGAAPSGIAALNLLAVTVDPDFAALPLAPGLDDAFFEADGPITTPELRALAIAALAPQAGETLWDIGAGTGSVAIEWMLRRPGAMGAVAIEREPARLAAIGRNARALGTPDLRVVGGEAPAVLASIDGRPDAVFVGGGGRAPTLEAAWSRLRPGGRLVVHSVTLETDAALAEAESRWGGQLIRVAIERAGPLGGFRGYRPSMTVTQWATVRP